MQDTKEYEFNTEILKSSEFLKSSFYMDMRCFKDLYLGILMRHIVTQEMYDKFYEFVTSDSYKNRIIDNKEVWFDKEAFGIFHDEINEILKQKELHDKIFLSSPNTKTISFIKNCITTSLECHTIFSENNSKLELSFNTYPLKLSKKYKIILKALLDKNLQIESTVIYNTPSELASKINKYDCLFIYDFEEILKLNAFEDVKSENEAIQLSKLHIFTYRLIHDRELLFSKTRDEIDKDFVFCEQYMNIFFDFIFMNPSSINIEKEE
jgi:hypothetical protein